MPTAVMSSIREQAFRAMRAAIDDSSRVVAEAIHTSDDELGEQLMPSTWAYVRATFDDVLSGDGHPAALEAVDAYAQAFAQQGLPLGRLVAAHRLGQQLHTKLWLRCLQERADDVDDLADTMQELTDRIFERGEAIQVALTLAYTRERGRDDRCGPAIRRAEVRTVLARQSVDATASSSRLRYRLDGRHVGFVVWHEAAAQADDAEVGRAVHDEVEAFAAEVVHHLGCGSPLLVTFGQYLAGWTPRTCAPAPAELPRGRNGLRVAYGAAWSGIEGFRRTHEEALEARRVTMLSTRPGTSCVPFTAVAFDALATQDLDAARAFVAHELGSLLADDDATRRIVATLDIFLQEQSSFASTARRLGVHANTVTYRVRQAEKLLGRRTTERQLELRAALRLLPRIPRG